MASPHRPVWLRPEQACVWGRFSKFELISQVAVFGEAIVLDFFLEIISKVVNGRIPDAKFRAGVESLHIQKAITIDQDKGQKMATGFAHKISGSHR